MDLYLVLVLVFYNELGGPKKEIIAVLENKNTTDDELKKVCPFFVFARSENAAIDSVSKELELSEIFTLKASKITNQVILDNLLSDFIKGGGFLNISTKNRRYFKADYEFLMLPDDNSTALFLSFLEDMFMLD